MALMRWFRRHQRHLLAAVAVLLMIAWGILPAFMRMGPEADGLHGRIRGELVTHGEFEDAQMALNLLVDFQMMDPQLPAALRARGAPLSTQSIFAVLADEFRQFVFDDEPLVTAQAAWRYLVLLREAEAAGIEVSPAEQRDVLTGLLPPGPDGQFDQEAYQQLLLAFRFTDAQFTRWTRQIARVAKLISLKNSSVIATRPGAWMTYRFAQEQARIEFVEVEPAWFELVDDATEEELREFFEQHRDTVADPEAGVIGYMAPRRVRLEYAEPPFDAILEEVVVTEEEILQYYEENKDELYVIEDDEEPAEEEAEDPDAEADEEVEPTPRYRPLEEVRDSIHETLTRRKAMEESERRVEAALQDLRRAADRYAIGPQPLDQMARRHGLDYRVAATEDEEKLLSRQQVEELVPAGQQVASFAFDREQNLHFPQRIDRTEQPPLICQVLEKREPEEQQFEDVREQVRADYARSKALERAEAFAGNFLEYAEQEGLEAAVAEFSGRLARLLEGGEASEGELAEWLGVRESETFSRTQQRVPGLDRSVPNVVQRAFDLDEGGMAVVREEPPVARVYVIRTIERQPAPPERFAQMEQMFRFGELYRQRRLLLDEWMDGLLAQAEPGDEITN